MFYNPNLFFSIFIGLFFFFLSRFICRKIKNNILHILIAIIFFLFSIPAILFIATYFHVLDPAIWYIQLRSIDNIEIFNSGLGLFIGYISKLMDRTKTDIKRLTIYLLLTILFLLIPYIKPIISPIKRFNTFKNQWKNEVCIQTTGSTCGPSSLATILKYYGINKTEEEIARASFTSGTSTEIWYIIRYARHLGLQVEIYNKSRIEEVPPPSIIGTVIGDNIGHFITLLNVDKDKILIGDSLEGKKEMSIKEFEAEYKFKGLGFFIELKNKSNKH